MDYNRCHCHSTSRNQSRNPTVNVTQSCRTRQSQPGRVDAPYWYKIIGFSFHPSQEFGSALFHHVTQSHAVGHSIAQSKSHNQLHDQSHSQTDCNCNCATLCNYVNECGLRNFGNGNVHSFPFHFRSSIFSFGFLFSDKQLISFRSTLII